MKKGISLFESDQFTRLPEPAKAEIRAILNRYPTPELSPVEKDLAELPDLLELRILSEPIKGAIRVMLSDKSLQDAMKKFIDAEEDSDRKGHIDSTNSEQRAIACNTLKNVLQGTLIEFWGWYHGHDLFFDDYPGTSLMQANVNKLKERKKLIKNLLK